MENSSSQVKVLIWQSKRADKRGVSGPGHVELLISDKCYGFFFDPKLKPSHMDQRQGCKGFLLSRSLASVAMTYFWQLVHEGREDDIVEATKHKHLPVVQVFAFEAKDENMRKLTIFLDSVIRNPPLYAIKPDRPNIKPNCSNCQTTAVKALSEADIFRDPKFHDVSPDGLCNLLIQKRMENLIGLIGPTEWQLKGPIFA